MKKPSLLQLQFFKKAKKAIWYLYDKGRILYLKYPQKEFKGSWLRINSSDEYDVFTKNGDIAILDSYVDKGSFVLTPKQEIIRNEKFSFLRNYVKKRIG